jgi:hypothetical protein
MRLRFIARQLVVRALRVLSIWSQRGGWQMGDEVFVKSAPLGGSASSRLPRGQAVDVYDAQGVSNAEGGAAVFHCDRRRAHQAR